MSYGAHILRWSSVMPSATTHLYGGANRGWDKAWDDWQDASVNGFGGSWQGQEILVDERLVYSFLLRSGGWPTASIGGQNPPATRTQAPTLTPRPVESSPKPSLTPCSGEDLRWVESAGGEGFGVQRNGQTWTSASGVADAGVRAMGRVTSFRSGSATVGSLVARIGFEQVACDQLRVVMRGQNTIESPMILDAAVSLGWFQPSGPAGLVRVSQWEICLCCERECRPRQCLSATGGTPCWGGVGDGQGSMSAILPSLGRGRGCKGVRSWRLG